MNTELIQAYSGFSAETKLYSQGTQIGQVFYPNNFVFGTPFYLTAGRYQYAFGKRSVEVGFPFKSVDGKPASHIQDIYYDQHKYGHILRINEDLGFLHTYTYIQLETQANFYSMYEIGLGKAGNVYPIYCNGNLVAEIWKSCKVLNNLDQYTLIALTPADMLHAYMLAAYLESNDYANRGQVANKSTDICVYKTTNKHLLSKYQPAFHEHMGLDISKFAI